MASVLIANTHWTGIRLHLDQPPFGEYEIPGARVSNADGTSTTRKYGWREVDEDWWNQWLESHQDQEMVINKVVYRLPESDARRLRARGHSSNAPNPTPAAMPFQSGRR